MRNLKSAAHERVNSLLEKPKRLLATLLIANTLFNVAIIVLSAATLDKLLSVTPGQELMRLLVLVLIITFVLLLFGEVMPKLYASRNPRGVALSMSSPVLFLRRIFSPLSSLLVSGTTLIDKKIRKKSKGITVDELGQALELTLHGESASAEEKKMLEGIVRFGQTGVKQIMKPRMDVIAFELHTPYPDLLAQIIESGFSRVPVYEDSLDQIKGVLYIKDLLPHLSEKTGFEWQSLIREAFFVPETKKIDDLLKEFKDNKVHLAIVVDEYGGTQGIVTLEDVIEEIVGEITDEFDDEDIAYTRIDDQNYVFEGKTALIDLYKVLRIDGEEFEAAKGESDTLAGFLLEQSEKMLVPHEQVTFRNYTFTIEAADKRRIKQVKVTLPQAEESENGKSGKFSFPGLLLCLLLLSACGSGETPIPKPEGYMRITFPEKSYTAFEGDCPYLFETPAYSFVEHKGLNPEEICSKNILFPTFKATLHLTYKSLSNNLQGYIEDCHSMAYEHAVKATAIEQENVANPEEKVYGLIYHIKGNAASPLQFYLTDTTTHFIRGALYFSVRPNYDSLRPSLDFLTHDVHHFIETFRWKKN